MKIDASDQIEKFQEFFSRTYEKTIHELAAKSHKALEIDFFELTKFDPELAEQLLEEPAETIKAAELAIEHSDVSNIRTRFYNLPQTQKEHIRNLRHTHLGKLICIEGIIRQSSDVRPEAVSAKFECPTCGNAITLMQTEAKFREPSRCSCGRRGHFRLLDKTLIDIQRIVIEESPEALDSGAQGKRLAVFLREDLVEPRMERKTIPGSKVRITGVLEEIQQPHKDGGMSKRFDISMNSNHIALLEEDFSDVEITEEDEEMIKNLAKDPEIYDKLTRSIAPSIYGHTHIKTAIMLQLFGGVRKEKKDGTVTRGDMHVLLVGDPGVSKSQMLTFVNCAAPKSRYVAGKASSSAGLTASVVKDEFMRGWALEAGAIVLADRGILCIDEFDKMGEEDTSSLHQALEQQTVTIAKANVQATLRAQTSVLAAANPKMGRFDPYAPLASQIDMPPALISRFDLIFVMRDIPNRELDTKIAEQVLKNQTSRDREPEIKSNVLKKYLAYVKQRVFPVLTDEAIEVIQEFYVDLRNSGVDGDESLRPIPISARNLEAVVRLAEASARIRLAKKVTKKDVKRALDLIHYYLTGLGIDPETGKIDIDRINTGVTTSARSKIISVRDLIYEMDAAGIRPIPIPDLIKEATSRGMKEQEIEESIEKLKRNGDLFEPKKGFIQKI